MMKKTWSEIRKWNDIDVQCKLYQYDDKSFDCFVSLKLNEFVFNGQLSEFHDSPDMAFVSALQSLETEISKTAQGVHVTDLQNLIERMNINLLNGIKKQELAQFLENTFIKK